MSVYTAPVFPFFPNWSSPVEETREWMTDILKAADGTEQRTLLRGTPRVGVSFDIVMTDEQELQTLYQLLWARAGAVFALPCWWAKTRLEADVLAGATSLTC